mgnify:CR=1 FL=1
MKSSATSWFLARYPPRPDENRLSGMDDPRRHPTGAHASGIDGAERDGGRAQALIQESVNASTGGQPDGMAEDKDNAATNRDEDDVDEPALQRDLRVSEERETCAAINRSRSHTLSQPALAPNESKRAMLSSWDARLLKATTYSMLAFATLWGVLARLGLEWIGKFADREVFFLIWPQIVGCLVMGFAVDRKKGIERA